MLFRSLVEKVLSALSWQIREAGADVRLDPLPSCRVDAIQMTEVFSNLISNAIKFLSPTRPGLIRISGTAAHGRAVYTVEDNGIGIAPQHQTNIFEMFHRLDPAATPGDGLGLTLVRQILSRLDGSIRVESVPDQGSRFIIEVPAMV